MEFIAFATILTLAVFFLVLGRMAFAFSVMSMLMFIILGATLLTGPLTVTGYDVVVVNNTTQIVNTTTILFGSPPWNWLFPILLMFTGIIGLVIGRSGRGGGRFEFRYG